jgi:hypothetical protein
LRAEPSDRLWGLAPATIAGVLTLAGVFVGLFGSGWAERAKEARRDSGDLRQAKRLVALEIRGNALALANLDLTRIGHADTLSLEAWEKHRELLARKLSDEDWTALYTFYGNVNDFRRTLRMAPLIALADWQLDGVRDARELAEELEARLGDRPTPYLRAFGTRRVPYKRPREADDPTWPFFVRMTDSVVYPDALRAP